LDDRLIDLKSVGCPLRDHSRGHKLGPDAVVDIPCNIWTPAARPDVIHEGNVNRLHTRLMAQGANIPCTAKAEEMLAANGVLVIPDFIATAGGVICAAMEWQHATRASAFAAIDEKVRANTRAVMNRRAPCGLSASRATPASMWQAASSTQSGLRLL
jgi:glutamate dehydrogenase (NAD(P)+)